ncbi:MAG: T9SS type A sorting domain-containing protein [Flavobacteriales bacterium]|nr:T9SS type A sorting domain-containing protein [Flavobacteriales bacterium]
MARAGRAMIQQGVLSGAPVLLRIDADGTIGPNRRIWADQQSSSPYGMCSLDRLPDGTMVACAFVDALDGSVLFTLDSTGSPEPSARFVPDSALVTAIRALALDNGDLLLHGSRVDPAVAEAVPLIARWDPANPFPCGSSTVPVLTDSIVPVLDSTFVRLSLSPTVEDITAQILPDTITWTVSEPCAISTGGQELPHVGTGLRAFPNPADRTARWAGLPGTQELALLDARGQVMRSWQRPLPEVLELSGLPNGLYLLVAKSNNGMRSTRVLVQH